MNRRGFLAQAELIRIETSGPGVSNGFREWLGAASAGS